MIYDLKKFCWPEMIFWSGVTFIHRWSCFKQQCYVIKRFSFPKYRDTIQKQGKFFPPYFGVGPDWFCWFFCYNFPVNFLSWLIIILQQNSATLSHKSKHTRTEIAPLTRPVEAQQIVPPWRIGHYHMYIKLCLSNSILCFMKWEQLCLQNRFEEIENKWCRDWGCPSSWIFI